MVGKTRNFFLPFHVFLHVNQVVYHRTMALGLGGEMDPRDELCPPFSFHGEKIKV